MKISEKFIRIGLILMVALSLYFSYAIWLSPAGKTSINLEESNSQVIESQSYRKASEIYLPLHLTWFQTDTVKETNSENLISQIHGWIEGARFGKLTEVVEADQEKFNQKKSLNEGIEFSYNAPYLLSGYVKAFGLNIDLGSVQNEDVYFTSVQFDLKDEKVSFIDYDQRTIYEASLSMDWKEIEHDLNSSDVNWTPVFRTPESIETQHSIKEPMKLKNTVISYLSNHTPSFGMLFFPPDAVKNNDESTELIFYDGNETMTIHSENQIVDFRGDLPTIDEPNNIFTDSFPYVSKLGGALGNVRYFDRNKNTIDYRIFVEGFPVFGSDSKGKVGIEIGNEQVNNQVSIQTSLNTIQVPIPSDEEVELPSTDDVYQELVDNGAEESKIELIIVGYTWQNIEETNRVVDLFPEWYVKYQGEWYSANELLTKLPEKEAE